MANQLSEPGTCHQRRGASACTPALLPAQEAGPTQPCIVSRLLLTTGTRVRVLLPGGGSLAGTEFQMQQK